MPRHARLPVTHVWDIHTHGLNEGLAPLPFAFLAEAG
jgi:hypothetical protein